MVCLLHYPPPPPPYFSLFTGRVFCLIRANSLPVFSISSHMLTNFLKMEAAGAGELDHRLRSGGSEFNSQHTHGGSQPSVSAVAGDLTPISGLQEHCVNVAYRHTCRQNTLPYKNKKLKKYI